MRLDLLLNVIQYGLGVDCISLLLYVVLFVSKDGGNNWGFPGDSFLL